MNMQAALNDLDKHASEFNFPMLDNAYVEMAAARFTAFRGQTSWAVVFEVLGYSIRQDIFADDFYTFGSGVREEGFVGSNPVMEQDELHPLVDPYSNAWIADWADWSISVHGKLYRFTPTREEYTSQGIHVPVEAGPGSLSERQTMRFFISREGTGDLFMSGDELRAELHVETGMSLFLQTRQWQHPDVAGEEKPSENASIRSLLAALNSDSPSAFQEGRPNTSWEHWLGSSEAE